MGLPREEAEPRRVSLADDVEEVIVVLCLYVAWSEAKNSRGVVVSGWLVSSV
jgi:hypothetical protein